MSMADVLAFPAARRDEPLTLVKPCSICANTAAFVVELSLGVLDTTDQLQRACELHLAVVADELTGVASARNRAGECPALYAWVVTVERYQR